MDLGGTGGLLATCMPNLELPVALARTLTQGPASLDALQPPLTLSRRSAVARGGVVAVARGTPNPSRL